jgi:2-polyprenyl-3-methyl-5-hydroxy-6-metoxy-1,4-benzoquinol methylase
LSVQGVKKSVIYRFLKSIIAEDNDILTKLTEQTCIYDMCPNVIQHDEVYLDQHINRFVEILRMIVEMKPIDEKTLRILDVGAGVGFLSILLKVKYGYQVEAVDLKESVLFWEARFKKYGIPLKWCDITIEPLPYPAASFDVVIFSEVLEHLVASPIHALTEVKRVLKYNGTVILTTPNICRLANIGRLIIGTNILPDFRKYEQGSTPKTPHIREYTLDEVMSLIKEVKLSGVASRSRDHFHSYYRLLSVISYLLPRYRERITVRARKGQA